MKRELNQKKKKEKKELKVAESHHQEAARAKSSLCMHQTGRKAEGRASGYQYRLSSRLEAQKGSGRGRLVPLEGLDDFPSEVRVIPAKCP